MFKIMKVQTEEEYNAALARIEELFDCEEGTPEAMEFLAICSLVELYEDKHYHIGPPADPIASIEFAMDQRGLTRKDLVPYIGSLDRVVAVMSRKEDITMPMARALHKHLGIPAETLLQETAANPERQD